MSTRSKSPPSKRMLAPQTIIKLAKVIDPDNKKQYNRKERRTAAVMLRRHFKQMEKQGLLLKRYGPVAVKRARKWKVQGIRRKGN